MCAIFGAKRIGNQTGIFGSFLSDHNHAMCRALQSIAGDKSIYSIHKWIPRPLLCVSTFVRCSSPLDLIKLVARLKHLSEFEWSENGSVLATSDIRVLAAYFVIYNNIIDLLTEPSERKRCFTN